MFFRLILFFLLQILNSADISDYFGKWRGYANGDVVYDLYIEFPGIMKDENDIKKRGSYELKNRTKLSDKNLNNFEVKEQIDTNCYDANIYYDIFKNEKSIFRKKIKMYAKACLHSNMLYINFFTYRGKAWFFDDIKKNTIFFEFDTGLNGRLERVVPHEKSKGKKKPVKKIDPDILKPIENKKG
ncbi:MAG: hypothetical protein KA059_07665 [Elusimicrobiales bacterium]|nr:hypothetical protein [Elusimicrobiales bacterium]